MTPPGKRSKLRDRELIERFLAIIALLTIVIAYFLGLDRARAVEKPNIEGALPTADRFEPISDSIYAGYRNVQLVGYVGINRAIGYGGPMDVAVGIDTEGTVVNMVVLYHMETPEYLIRVKNDKLFESLIGKSYKDPFKLGVDVDGISGATYTSYAVVEAIRRAIQDIVEADLMESQVVYEHSNRTQFGIPEISLVIFFSVGYFAHSRKFKYTRQARWISMIAGLLILGFWLNRPLTISNINQLLLGFWPNWQTNLYWYILIGGILFVFTADNKNPYCEWFCPFGAAQECLAVVGNAKVRSPGIFREYLKWAQRGLAWLAILLAVYFRNPGISSYEVFGALFARIGSTILFVLLGIVLVASLFIKRPWCTYLCPLRPVDGFIRMVRKWILDIWKKIVRKTA